MDLKKVYTMFPLNIRVETMTETVSCPFAVVDDTANNGKCTICYESQDRFMRCIKCKSRSGKLCESCYDKIDKCPFCRYYDETEEIVGKSLEVDITPGFHIDDINIVEHVYGLNIDLKSFDEIAFVDTIDFMWDDIEDVARAFGACSCCNQLFDYESIDSMDYYINYKNIYDYIHKNRGGLLNSLRDIRYNDFDTFTPKHFRLVRLFLSFIESFELSGRDEYYVDVSLIVYIRNIIDTVERWNEHNKEQSTSASFSRDENSSIDVFGICQYRAYVYQILIRLVLLKQKRKLSSSIIKREGGFEANVV